MPNHVLHYDTQLAVEPAAGEQLIGINQHCLIMQSFRGSFALNYAYGAMLIFWMMGLPGFLLSVAFPWMPPYGYDDGVKIETLSQLLAGLDFSEVNYFGYFLMAFLLGGMPLMLSIGMARLALYSVANTHSPIRFNRKDQIISSISNGKAFETPWKDIRAYPQTHNMLLPSAVVSRRGTLTLMNANEEVIAQIHESPYAEGFDGHELFEGSESLWEYIRIYMLEGPEGLPVPKEIFKSWDLRPQYSIPHNEILKHHLPWPIIKLPHASGYAKFFLFITWPIRIFLFIPSLLAEWLWRIMCLRVLPKGKANPELFKQGCGDDLITTAMARSVSKPPHAEMFELPYLEVIKRLEEKEKEVHPPTFTG